MEAIHQLLINVMLCENICLKSVEMKGRSSEGGRLFWVFSLVKKYLVFDYR